MNVEILITGEGKKYGNEYHMPCFLCGGNDRFILWDNGRWWCRQCNRKGDGISLLMQRDGFTYKQACERLGETPRTKTTPTPTTPKPTLQASTPRHHEGDFNEWQRQALRLQERATDYMLEHYENPAWEWIANRKLTITGSLFGYIPTDYKSVWGGVDVYLPSGLLISWFDGIEGKPYKLNIRRLNPKPNENKYHMVKGSENGLYLSHFIEPNKVVVMVEGELDALSINQATHRRVLAVATGATTGGRLVKHIARLALAKLVLVAFDDDEAGENASQYWLNLLPNSKRLKPLAHDPNDMLRAGYDLNQWIRGGL